MNIFVLDPDPARAARGQCDKHVVKMVTETAQLLCSAFPPGIAPYRHTHRNHPCSLWARASRQNYAWLARHGRALAAEYSYRYGKVHRSAAVIAWCAAHARELALPDIGLTPFPQAMPDEYKAECPIEAYRSYYRGAKRSFASWTRRRPPAWWTGSRR